MVKYETALRNLASALRTATYEGPFGLQTGYKHAFFDIANESNLDRPPQCKPLFTEPEIAGLLAAVRQGDPERLGTASTTEGEPPENWAITDGMTANLVAYHEPRAPFQGNPWWVMTFWRMWGHPDPPYYYLGWRQVTDNTIPIYFGEEERHRYLPESACNQFAHVREPGCADNYTAEQFLESARGAKAAGAAGYTWHTQKLFRWSSNYAPGLTALESEVVFKLQGTLAAQPWPR